MNQLIHLHNSLFSKLERADWMLPTLARILFAAVLLVYYWNSGLTKLGEGLTGLFQPSAGAYAQILPRIFEAAGYDTSALSVFHRLVVLGGTWAEFLLPALIVLGLASRLAALGMIGFVLLQSLTDIIGHHADAATIGGWFDRFEGSAILDQRSLWVLLLLVIVVKGGGPFSADRLLARRFGSEM
ncbi:hypothetical protein [Shimia sp.]|uniref:hypothetical protein n=1 Tax=Shimia sp. TaxID=1954381 RepID=UPI0035659E4D